MRRPRRWWAAALAGVAALIAAPAAPASVVALQDDRLPNHSGAELGERLDLLAGTGTRVTRVDVLWDQVAPTRPAAPRDPDDPAYRWDRYDEIVRGLQARGIGVILSYYRTPPWGSASGRVQAAPRPAEAAAFAGAMARRYSGRHPGPDGRPLPRVRRFEIWNEPNIDYFWSPQCRRAANGGFAPVAAYRYAALASAAVREIRRAQPDAVVIGGVAGPAGGVDERRKRCRTGTESVSPVTMVNRLRAERVAIDAWSQHLYPIGSPSQAVFFPSWRTLPQLQRALDRLRPGLPIYVTETGYHTSYNRFHRYFVSERQQAEWLEETFVMARRNPRVALTVWFNLQDNPSWTGGLLRGDLSRKPAWETYARLARAQTPAAEWLP
ncbi:MAG TPA: hypothetical protein VNT51_03225 [Miltoncostaeaceae bacterium]|nr:hypothetical protein [Miltoncostaeaceae bacterium]